MYYDDSYHQVPPRVSLVRRVTNVTREPGRNAWQAPMLLLVASSVTRVGWELTLALQVSLVENLDL